MRSVLGPFALTAVLVLAGACSSNELGSSPSTTVPVSTTAAVAGSPADVLDGGDNPAELAMLTRLGDAYLASAGLWAGFDPMDHPAVIAVTDQGTITHWLAINHPDPGALGDATVIDVPGAPFSVSRITEPSDGDRLAAGFGFEFDIELGGVSAFAIEADPGEPILDPSSPEFVSTFIHEMFHRYQLSAFPPLEEQDVEGYAYTEENLRLAILEDRALTAALDATDVAGRTEAARHFAAIRLVRLAADERVRLDGSQEVSEGTARYLEHRLGGDDPDYSFNDTNWSIELVSDPSDIAVKDTYGFGRWYATGAGILHLLDQFGVDDHQQRIESGERPAAILSEALGVTDELAPGLAAEAASVYDPPGQLDQIAADAAQRAAEEGPVFSES